MSFSGYASSKIELNQRDENKAGSWLKARSVDVKCPGTSCVVFVIMFFSFIKRVVLLGLLEHRAILFIPRYQILSTKKKPSEVGGSKGL